MSLYDVFVMMGFTHVTARRLSEEASRRGERLEVERKLNGQSFEVEIDGHGFELEPTPSVYEGVTLVRWHRPADRPPAPPPD